jgi:hypothetical protein
MIQFFRKFTVHKGISKRSCKEFCCELNDGDGSKLRQNSSEKWYQLSKMFPFVRRFSDIEISNYDIICLSLALLLVALLMCNT